MALAHDVMSFAKALTAPAAKAQNPDKDGTGLERSVSLITPPNFGAVAGVVSPRSSWSRSAIPIDH
jgi:hypothetical protein